MIANLPILALLAVSTSSAFAGRQGPSRLSQRHRQVQQGRRDNATVSSGSNATEPLDFEATGGAFNATGGGIATFSSNATIFGNSTFGNNTAFGNNATEGGFPIPTSSPLPVEEQPSSEPEQTGSEDDLPWCDEVDVDEANEGDNAASASGAEEQQPTAASSGSSDGTSTADAPAPTVDAAASCDAASTPVVTATETQTVVVTRTSYVVATSTAAAPATSEAATAAAPEPTTTAGSEAPATTVAEEASASKTSAASESSAPVVESSSAPVAESSSVPVAESSSAPVEESSAAPEAALTTSAAAASSEVPAPVPTSSVAVSSAEPSTTSVVIQQAAVETASTTAASAASSAAAAPTADSGVSGDAKKYLDAHNNFRRQYNAKDLVWDETLAAAAQKWASNCDWKHSQGAVGDYGENLATGTGAYTIESAIKAWTDEAPDYNKAVPNYSHFTQVVWKSTSKLGCAVATCNDLNAFGPGSGAAQFYVCEYSTPGNYLGEFSQNVEGTTCTNC